MSWRRLHSRSSVPTAPRKYFVVTMLAALTLQKSGNSTPRCSKLTEPSRQLVITTSRRSHATSSYGCTPAVVQTRSIRRPGRPTGGWVPVDPRRPPARAVVVDVAPLDVLPAAGAFDPLVALSPAIRLAPSRSHGRRPLV